MPRSGGIPREYPAQCRFREFSPDCNLQQQTAKRNDFIGMWASVGSCEARHVGKNIGRRGNPREEFPVAACQGWFRWVLPRRAIDCCGNKIPVALRSE